MVRLTETCFVPPKRDRRGPCLPAGPEPGMVQGRQERAQYERHFLCSHSVRHCVLGKPRPHRGASLLLVQFHILLIRPPHPSDLSGLRTPQEIPYHHKNVAAKRHGCSRQPLRLSNCVCNIHFFAKLGNRKFQAGRTKVIPSLTHSQGNPVLVSVITIPLNGKFP